MRAEPSLFSVGGVQSRVTVPVETGFGGGGVDATGGEFDVGGDVGLVLLGAGAAPWVVPPATPGERSIRPTLGATEFELTDAAVEALDPASEPQAARPNVARVHNTTLRMRERAANVGFFIDHHPGSVNGRQGSDTSRERTIFEVVGRDPNNDNHRWVAGNPAISNLLQLETGGFASPPYGGFALALWGQ